MRHAIRDRRRLAAALSAIAFAAACAEGPRPEGAASAGLDGRRTLFEASDAVERDWQVVRLFGDPEFAVAAVGDEPALRLAAAGGAGGLGRWLDLDPEACPAVEWTWRVEALPETADLGSDAAEDVAAAISFTFGDPGSLTLPRPRPTLRYVWATETDSAGSVVASPYFPGYLRSLVVRSGPEGLGAARTERRDLLADFERAFGEPPEDPLRLIVLYVDSDHGESPLESFFFDAHALCAEAVEEDDGLPMIGGAAVSAGSRRG